MGLRKLAAPVAATLFQAAVSFGLFGILVTSTPLQSQSISWDDIPGRPFRAHVEGITFTRLIPQVESRQERNKKIQLRGVGLYSAGSQAAQHEGRRAYIVKVSKDQRHVISQTIKGLFNETAVTYLPHDSYIVVLPPHIVEQVANLHGVLSVLVLPKDMKTSPDILEELHGKEHEAALTRRSSKRTKPLEKVGNQTSNSSAEADLIVSVGRAGNLSVAGSWTESLVEAGLEAIVLLEDSGRGGVGVRVRGENGAVEAVIRWLIERDEVVWVQHRPQVQLLGLDIKTVMRSQAALRNENGVEALLGGEESNGELAVWSQGLRGDGQVIAVADTGLDFDHCAFADDADDARSLIPTCDDAQPCVNPGRHRKVYYYRSWGNSEVGDSVDGHGTHVAGSAVANTRGSSSLSMQGAAPEAKVAMEDIAREGARMPWGRDMLRIPESLTDFFQPSEEAGVRVHSDSWGYSESDYDLGTQEVDAFVYDHPEFVIVFAAGNQGSDGYRTVGAPAGAKNAISVGAAENKESVYTRVFGEFAYTPQFRVDAGDFMEGFRGGILFAEFGRSEYATTIAESEMVLMQSEDEDATLGCGEVRNGNELGGKVALIRRGTCFFQVKCLNAQRAGATACIIANDVEADELVTMSREPSTADVSIPSLFISKNDGDALERLVRFSLVPAEISLPIYMEFDPSNVASFSSRGPTSDMRIKPDVLAVGDWILSARSDGDLTSNQCSAQTAATYLSGTSMATPFVSGAAALIRQYFEQGFHVSGVADPSQGVTPSAALVKAVILHSGQEMQNRKRDQDMGLFPNFEQGHGSVKLSSVLSFADSDSFRLKTFDGQRVGDAQVWAACVAGADASQPLKVTLHWTDPPGSLQALYALVNNLDLAVEHVSSGHRVYGNAPSEVGEGYVPLLDDLNNNEQINVATPTAGEYRVLVSGRDVPVDPQTFALVITGSFRSASACTVPEEEVCPGGGQCSGHGRCVAGGVCVCDPTHAGADCASELEALHDEIEVTTPRVTVTGWVYYLIPVFNDQTWTLSADSLDWTLESDPDLYIAYNRVPTLSDFDFIDFRGPSTVSYRIGFDDVRNRPRNLASAQDGYWVVGIHAYCCRYAQLKLRVSMGPSDRPEPFPTNPRIEPVTTPTPIPRPDDGFSASDDDTESPPATPSPPPPSQPPSTPGSNNESPMIGTTTFPIVVTTPAPPSPMASPPSGSDLVAFTASLAMDRESLLASLDTYREGVARAAEVLLDSVYVTQVSEVFVRRLTRTVEVATVVVVDDDESGSAVVEKLSEERLAAALVQQGLPPAQLKVMPAQSGTTDEVEDEDGGGSDELIGGNILLVLVACGGVAAVIVAVLLCRRVKQAKPSLPTVIPHNHTQNQVVFAAQEPPAIPAAARPARRADAAPGQPSAPPMAVTGVMLSPSAPWAEAVGIVVR